MNAQQTTLLRNLIEGRSVAALGTLHDGAPYVSMVPFIIGPDRASFVVHVSRLSAHTRDMLADPRVSLLIVQPEGEGTPALALARVTIQGEAGEVAKGSEQWQACRAAYLDRFPEAAQVLEFADFSFFTIRPGSARFVAGFAQAMTLSTTSLTECLRNP